MTTRRAGALTVVAVLIVAAGLLLPPKEDSFFFFIVSIALSFALVGGLVAARRPENPVGWLFLGFGFVAGLAFLCDQYWNYAGVLQPGALPGAAVAAAIAVHVWHPGFAFFILGFLYFPDGTLQTPRWRLVAGFTVTAALIALVSGIFEYEFERGWYQGTTVPPPLFTGPIVAVADAVFGVGLVSTVAMFPVSAVGVALRYRRAGGAQRQQIKWVAFAIVLVAIALPASVILTGDGSYGAPLLPLIPISAGIAILRYRLFDIDRIINRTIVYTLVTAVLALGYAGLVVGVGSVLDMQGQSSNAVVAGATLLAAAAFRPLRSRTQLAVDRRFNRRTYDAGRTIEAFGSRLRAELDLDQLPAELERVVRDTMQPAAVSLWLRRL